MTDADVAAFDGIEGAYIPRFVPSSRRSRAPSAESGWTRVLNDFVLWDGHVVPTTYDNLLGPDPESEGEGARRERGGRRRRRRCRPRFVRPRIDDTGFGLVRALAERAGIPIHRMRLWGTTLRRADGTMRVSGRCLGASELRDSTVGSILGKHLGWTRRAGGWGEVDGRTGGGRVRRGRSRRRWIKDGCDHGFYLEILPEERTKSRNDIEDRKFLAKPPRVAPP